MAAEFKTADDIFECRLCGDCCEGFGGTYVSDDDIKKIAEYIGFNPENFKQTYCDTSGSKFVLTRGEDGYCIFFDPGKQCTIHPVKPYMCRAWPFLKTIIKNPENWDAMARACPGMKKNIPEKELKRIVRGEKENLDRSFGRDGSKKNNNPGL
jgi:hypothetical protein